jgi:hypothetical protein
MPMVSARTGPSPDESRKARRETVRRPGWIALGRGTPLLECTVWDESERGARLVINGAGHAPDAFYLYLSLDFSSRRHCRVAWRSDRQLGVEFIPEPADRQSASKAGADDAPFQPRKGSSTGNR